jgi:hypothetical protein
MLRSGQYKYIKNGGYKCPFCVRIIGTDYNSMVMHAEGVDHGSEHKWKPHYRAKHAAFVAFLRREGNRLPLKKPKI